MSSADTLTISVKCKFGVDELHDVCFIEKKTSAVRCVTRSGTITDHDCATGLRLKKRLPEEVSSFADGVSAALYRDGSMVVRANCNAEIAIGSLLGTYASLGRCSGILSTCLPRPSAAFNCSGTRLTISAESSNYEEFNPDGHTRSELYIVAVSVAADVSPVLLHLSSSTNATMAFHFPSAVSPDGRLAVTSDAGQPIRFWALTEGGEARELEWNHAAPSPVDSRGVYALQFSPDGLTLAVAGDSLVLLDLAPLVQSLDTGVADKGAPASSAATAATAASVATTAPGANLSAPQTVDTSSQVTSEAPALKSALLESTCSDVEQVEFSSDGGLLASGGRGVVAIYDVPARARLVRKVEYGRGSVRSLQFSDDACSLLVGDEKGVRIFGWRRR